MNNRYKTNSSLFLMEQLAVILIFSICAAVCVRIFAGSYIMARDSSDMNNALLMAESGAECLKAASGDSEKAARILGGHVVNADNGAVVVYYDRKWQVCTEGEAAYRMGLAGRYPSGVPASPALSDIDISVEKITGEEIVAFTVAVRKAV